MARNAPTIARRPRWKLSLANKVLLLIAFPVFSQFILIACMSSMQNEAEHETARAIKAKEISNRVNLIIKNIADLASAAGVDDTSTTSNIIVAERFKNNVHGIVATYSELEELTRDDPDKFRIVERSANAARQSFKSFTDVIRGLMLGDVEHSERKNLWRRLRQDLRTALSSDLINLSNDQEKISAEFPVAQAKRREQTRQLLNLAACINLVSAVFIALFVIRNVQSRFKVVLDNTERLAEGQPLNPVITGNDEIAAFDGTFHNMADKLSEAARKERELIGMITHDLRTPLGSLGNVLEMLSWGSYGTLSEKGSGMLDIAMRSTTQMGNLINDLLDLEKARAGMMEISLSPHPLNDLFDESCQIVQPTADKVQVTLERDKTDIVVKADAERLKRIIVNLLGNALKFSPSGSTVHLTATKTGDYAQISVRDEGSGIEPQKIPHLFDRYYQTAAEHARLGSGLGLSICKVFTEMHGGTISVKSELGKFTEFTFTIPAA